MFILVQEKISVKNSIGKAIVVSTAMRSLFHFTFDRIKLAKYKIV